MMYPELFVEEQTLSLDL